MSDEPHLSAAPLWTKVDSTVYSLTYVMGFIVAGAFFLLFLLLIIFQGAVRENHRRSRRSRYPDGASLPPSHLPQMRQKDTLQCLPTSAFANVSCSSRIKLECGLHMWRLFGRCQFGGNGAAEMRCCAEYDDPLLDSEGGSPTQRPPLPVRD